ncbi:hypothetical protein ACFV4G_39665 [Kitasatospora sp. NPDC059747]|uniref:hypothetical protein n=1 Tax=Kitasatospora sp. NPDC059747 TaxID=3346930 RepID=UPI00366609EB
MNVITGKVTQLALFIVIVAGYVVLNLQHADTANYVALVTPVLGAVYTVSQLNQRSDAQDQALSVITHQTNGVLTARIQSAVADALGSQSATAGTPVSNGAAPIVPGRPPYTPAVPAPAAEPAPAAPAAPPTTG